jgi:hypothetical protein
VEYEERSSGSSSIPKSLRGDMIACCGNWKSAFSRSRISFFERLAPILQAIYSYSPPSCAFHAPLYVIVVEEELHAFFFVLLIVDYHANICRGCSISIALNNL